MLDCRGHEIIIRTTTSMGVRIDTTIYPLLAVQKAAAALSSRYVVEIAKDDEIKLVLTLRPRLDGPQMPDPVAHFLALLNDFCLLDKVAEQTKDIRTALVRAAFHEALPPTK